MKSIYLVAIFVVIQLCWAIKIQSIDEKRFENLQHEKYIPMGDVRLKIATVHHSTNMYLRASQSHEISNLMNFFNRDSYLVYNSLLPASGVYQGRRGVIEYLSKWWQTVHITDRTYQILFVDEARGTSAVLENWSGVFRHNNATFNNVSTITFIRWSMGKVKYINHIDLQPTQVYSLFQTKAEKSAYKLSELMYSCGDKCNEALSEHLADDVNVKITNLYPQSILLGEKVEQKTEKAGEKSTEARKDIILKGKDGFVKFVNVLNKLVLNVASRRKVLYADERTVVAALAIAPSFSANKKIMLKQLTAIYCIEQFNEQGKLLSADVIINRPLFPWNMRSTQNKLTSSGESLDKILAPLRSAIQA